MSSNTSNDDNRKLKIVDIPLFSPELRREHSWVNGVKLIRYWCPKCKTSLKSLFEVCINCDHNASKIIHNFTKSTI